MKENKPNNKTRLRKSSVSVIPLMDQAEAKALILQMPPRSKKEAVQMKEHMLKRT